MKRFRLPPIARQLIIFLLLIAILWQDKPLVGPDGLMLIEFTDFPAGKLQSSLAEGDYINICETIDNQSGGSRTQFILAAVPLARATWREPNKAYLFIDMYIPLRRIFPKRLRLDGGWILVLKLTPEEYEILLAARQRGGYLACMKGTPQDGRFVFKKNNKPN